MVNVTKGVLVKCDPAMKQFLLHLDETLGLGTKFVVQGGNYARPYNIMNTSSKSITQTLRQKSMK